MWYFQVKTLKVAKFYLSPAADRLRKRGSMDTTLMRTEEITVGSESRELESESGERSTATQLCIPSLEISEDFSSQGACGGNRYERRASCPAASIRRGSNRSDQFLSLPTGMSEKNQFPSLTSLVSNISRSYRRSSSIIEAEKIKKFLKRSQQMSKLTLSVMGCFSICWWPFITALAIHTLCPQSCNITPQIFHYLGILLILNHFSNVFIYTAKSKDFRSAFKQIFRCGNGSPASKSGNPTIAYEPATSCDHGNAINSKENQTKPGMTNSVTFCT